MSQFSAHDLALTGVGLFWLGAATTVLATWAQVTGQRRVGASRAAVSYALQPLWAVLTAVGLGVDGAGGWELFGGALIMSAGLILAILDFGKDA